MSEVGLILSGDDWEELGVYASSDAVERRALEKIILDALFLTERQECGERLRQLFTWYTRVRRADMLARDVAAAWSPVSEAQRQAIANAELRRRLRHVSYAGDPGADDEEIVAEAEVIEAMRYLAGR